MTFCAGWRPASSAPRRTRTAAPRCCPAAKTACHLYSHMPWQADAATVRPHTDCSRPSGRRIQLHLPLSCTYPRDPDWPQLRSDVLLLQRLDRWPALIFILTSSSPPSRRCKMESQPPCPYDSLTTGARRTGPLKLAAASAKSATACRASCEAGPLLALTSPS